MIVISDSDDDAPKHIRPIIPKKRGQDALPSPRPRKKSKEQSSGAATPLSRFSGSLRQAQSESPETERTTQARPQAREKTTTPVIDTARDPVTSPRLKSVSMNLELRNARKSTSEKQSEINSLEENLGSQKEEKEKECVSANAELVKLKSALDQAETANETSRNMITELRNELEVQKAILKSSQEEIQVATLQKHELASKLQVVEEEVSQARAQASRLETELEAANKRVAMLEEEREEGGDIFNQDPGFVEHAIAVCERIQNEITESQKSSLAMNAVQLGNS